MITYELNLDYSIRLPEITGKTVIVLDTNAWNNLGRETNEQYKEIKEILRSLVHENKIICPLMGENFSEFHRQTMDSLKNISCIVDELSKGFVFINREIIFNKEIEQSLDCLITNKKVFLKPEQIIAPIHCHVTNKVKHNFPYDFKDPRTKIFFKMFHDSLIYMTFDRYLDNIKLDMAATPALITNSLKEAFEADQSFSNFDKKKVISDNYEYTRIKIVIPKLYNLLIEKQSYFANDMNSLLLSLNGTIDDKLKEVSEYIMDNSLMLYNMVKVMSVAGNDLNRNFKPNDYFDIEMMITASSYADYLYSDDKWMIHTLNNYKGEFLGKCKFVRDKNEFIKMLNEI